MALQTTNMTSDMKEKSIFKYGIDHLTVGIALDIARGKTKGVLDKEAIDRIIHSQEAVEFMVQKGDPVYGINTGFGPLCNKKISAEDTATLQYNILKSHAVGVGEAIDKELSKLMLILKAHALSQGYSGVSLSTIERIVWQVDHNIIPKVPSQGSVGASGDLAPLSHLFLPLIGLGEVWENDDFVPTQKVLNTYNMGPITLGPKEGLALINGTQFMAAHGIRVVERLQACLDHADIIAAMNLEAMLGSARPFEKELHQIRPYEGNLHVANRMSTLLSGSEIMASHAHCTRVQDQYSLRCIPQVHGASRNAWKHLKETVLIEINSVTDNPIIIDKENAISGGNFHGQPIALPLDYATLAASEIGNISDRRIYFSLEGRVEGLPKLLMEDTGLNSGFMIPQYTSAALASENKTLCFPASADSIPTSLGQEDHVSMGSISGRKALQVIDNVMKILGIELICAAQGFDFRKPLKPSALLDVCHQYIRSVIPMAKKDGVLYPNIEQAIEIIKSNKLIELTNKFSAENGPSLKNQYHDTFGIY